MQNEDICYTREIALEKAIDMELKSFETYKNAYLKAKHGQVKNLLKELALDELEHKHTLEKAFFEETVSLHDAGMKEGPSMRFSLLLEEKPLTADSSVQEIMIYAIHEEKRSVDFYKSMTTQCSGAPMEEIFERLYGDEEKHLARLEELYESVYLKEM